MPDRRTHATTGNTASQHVEEALRFALQALAGRAWTDAVHHADRALAVARGNGFAHMVRGVALTGIGRFDIALPALEEATRLSPDDPRTHYNFAVSLQQAGHALHAMAAYRACLAIAPDFADALWNYGESLRLGEHFEQALELFDRLAAIEGGRRPHAAHRSAVCCAYTGQAERADALFQQQLAANDDPATHWEYALFLLKQERFDQAWPHYARRFDAGERIMVRGINRPYPAWNGQFEKDALLLVTGEQGAGDEILFAAFLPGLLRRADAAGMRVVIVCRPELVRLFRASFPGGQVESAALLDDMAERTSFDALGNRETANAWHAYLGDLPRWIEKPPPACYLQPDPADLAAARALIGNADESADRRGGTRPRRVGLVWSANPAVPQANRTARNVPSALINGWLGGLDNVQFYSLMPRPHIERVGEVADLPLTDLSAFVTDFSRTAAAIRCLDRVISVCTSTANLAGALGADLHVLLQRHADWRWARGGRAWYPNVTPYRQVLRGDWSPCFAALVRDLMQTPGK
jgi:tetratricopeptide (TPR) repeat protein